MRVAVIVNNTIENIIEAESVESAALLYPSAEVIDATGLFVQVGWVRTDGEWHPPEAAGPQYRTSISPVEFKMIFTPFERIAIRAARDYAGDEEPAKTTALLINDWYDIVDDPRLTAVNLALPQTQTGLDMLVAAGILTQARRDEIGLGVPV